MHISTLGLFRRGLPSWPTLGLSWHLTSVLIIMTTIIISFIMVSKSLVAHSWQHEQIWATDQQTQVASTHDPCCSWPWAGEGLVRASGSHDCTGDRGWHPVNWCHLDIYIACVLIKIASYDLLWKSTVFRKLRIILLLLFALVVGVHVKTEEAQET